MVLNNDDIKKVKRVIDESLDKKLDKTINKSLDERLGPKFENLEIFIEDVFDRKLDEKLDEKLKNLPTKKEFFGRMDKLLSQVQTSRSEQTLLSHRVSNHEDRLQIVEGKLKITPGY